MVAQHEYTKRHWTVYFNMVKCKLHEFHLNNNKKNNIFCSAHVVNK